MLPKPSNSICIWYVKWSKMKHILLDHRILLNVRVRLLETCVRNRLLYSVQWWQLSAKEPIRVEVVWDSFLRRMVKGGFKRKNVPKVKENIKKTDMDWAFVINNEKLREITKTTSIRSFCQIQHLKYIAHVTRLPNNALQKQLLFAIQVKGKHCRWKKISDLLGIEESQIRRTM